MVDPTRGPWRTNPPYRLTIIGENGEDVAEDSGYLRTSEAEANCRLIAAAPELLEACQAVLEGWYTKDLDEREKKLRWGLNLAESAICKATGEEEDL